MSKKILIVLLGLIGVSSIAIASDYNSSQQDTSLLPIVIFLVFFAIYIFIAVKYIMSQQSLSNAYSNANQTDRINSAWFWTLLIPLWNMVAIIVCVTKISEQAKELNDRARRARREFGSNIQDLEEDDEAQYKKIPFGRIEDDGTTRNISGDCTEPVCLQFKGSPYYR